MKIFYKNKIEELYKRKRIYFYTLIIIIVMTLMSTAYIVNILENRNTDNLSLLSKIIDNQEIDNSSQSDMENLKYMISEMAANDRTVINEFFLVITILVSFTGAALINGYLETSKQIDELEEKLMLANE